MPVFDPASAFEVAPIPSLILDRALVVVEANRRWRSATRREPGELAGQALAGVWPGSPATRAQAVEALERLVRTGAPQALPSCDPAAGSRGRTGPADPWAAMGAPPGGPTPPAAVPAGPGATSWRVEATPVPGPDGPVDFILLQWFEREPPAAAGRHVAAGEHAALLRADARLRLVLESARDYIVIGFDAHALLNDWSAGAEASFGWTREEALGQPAAMIFTPEDRAAGIDAAEIATARRDGNASDVRWHLRKDGTRIYLNGSLHRLPSDDAGDPAAAGFVKIARDETERQHAELRRDGVVRVSAAFRNSSDPAELQAAAVQVLGETLAAARVSYGAISEDETRFLVDGAWSRADVRALPRAVRLTPYGTLLAELRRNEVVRIADAATDRRMQAPGPALRPQQARARIFAPIVEHRRLVAMLVVDDDRPRQWSAREAAFVREIAELTHHAVERARGERALRDSEAVLRAINDTLEDKVAERTRDLVRTEEALRQSQKMEAVGQLTGGIAHDFNNLLAAISASLEVLDRRLASQRFDGASRYIGMSLDAVRRAGTLTHRLLAFSRRQTLDPKPTDVDRLVAGMEDLIRRAVGPDVRLEVADTADLWTTLIDPPQLENALLNLCLNARDAMSPSGGRLAIGTANRRLDAAAAAATGHGLAPGDYVSLCVTDSGAGMSAETIGRIFDPFFTTKPIGQGTGLGLSMVYGFVRQSGGQVDVHSTLGGGTTLCLYLPRHVGEASDGPDGRFAIALAPGDGATVLVIEDEKTVQLLIAEVLTEAGYRVLTADDGAAGLRILACEQRIDLLLTDVGLPGGLNGRQVAEAARERRPALKVLFVTGYAEQAALGGGGLGPGMEVVTKPFELVALANKVGEMVQRPARCAGPEARAG